MKKYLVTLLFLLTACSSHKVTDYQAQSPQINLKEFFNGKIRALGIVQDRSRKVIKRFTVEIDAQWDGDTGTLDESFVYSDGTKDKRVWTLKGKNKHFQGSAHDVIGTATGETSGNAFYFEYELKLPVDDSVYHVTFEDWMFQLDQNTLLARSYMSKWGINLGEVTIIMTKQDQK